MTTSGSYSWQPDVGEVISEAFDRCGVDPSTIVSRHLVSARRSLNYLFVQWANDGVHLWAVDQQSQLLTASAGSYSCPVGTIAILEMVVRRDGIDTPVFPMSRDEYLAIPDKTTEGLPNRFWFNRDATTPSYTLWDVPENSTDTVYYYRMRQLQDITASAETADVPYRWQEALAAGLAAKLAEKYAPDRENFLRNKAGARYAEAFTEDRERAPTTFRPSWR